MMVSLGYVRYTGGMANAKTLDQIADGIPDGAQYALVEAETANIRWRDDGVDPTASIGHVIAAGSSKMFEGWLAKVAIIGVTAAANLNVTFYKQA